MDGEGAMDGGAQVVVNAGNHGSGGGNGGGNGVARNDNNDRAPPVQAPRDGLRLI